MSTVAAHHSGLCRKLALALKQLMPQKFKLIIETHYGETDDECFCNSVFMIFAIATSEDNLEQKYAMVCHRISEIIQSKVTKVEKTQKDFKCLLTNQCQIYVNHFW